MSHSLPTEYLGATTRIGSGPAPELVATGYALETADAPILHRGLGLADLAHIQALTAAQAIPRSASAALSDELLAFLATPVEDFPYDAIYGDAYNSREREMQRRLGAVSGWLHLGRTRREAGRIAFRIALRRELLTLHQSVSQFTQALTGQSRRHADTVWADTTYLQPAQPSTFGHFLGAFAEEANRNLDRVRRAYEWTNRSPAGTGGVSGTMILPNRDEDAARLGFDGPGLHTRDIMWSVDGLVDVVVAATQAVTTVDRLCEDLEIFASPAFNYVRLDGSLCRASVLLPQKRNPYALAVVRSGASLLVGRATGMLTAQRSPSARTDNWLHACGEVMSAVQTASRLVDLGSVIVETLQVDSEALRDAAAEHFTGAADLAEHLVLIWGVDYRSAYEVVGHAVTESIARHDKCIRQDVLMSSAKHVLGTGSHVVPDAAIVAGDPTQLAYSRDVLGGSAPTRVRLHADHVDSLSAAANAWRTEAWEAIKQSEDDVVAQGQRLAGERRSGA